MNAEDRKRVEDLVASFFDATDDIIGASFAIQTYIERRLEQRRKKNLERTFEEVEP